MPVAWAPEDSTLGFLSFCFMFFQGILILFVKGFLPFFRLRPFWRDSYPFCKDFVKGIKSFLFKAFSKGVLSFFRVVFGWSYPCLRLV